MKLSDLSTAHLATCHPLLIQLVLAVAVKTDLLVICGERNEQDQDAAFANGKSRLRWPSSRHNSVPSEAADLAPYPVVWTDTASFAQLAQVMKDTAVELGIEIEWGGDWATFKDMDHFQLKAGTF